MKVVFSINYHTNWGQKLLVSGSVKELGSGVFTKSVPMKYVDNGQWILEIDIDSKDKFNYRYLIFDEQTKSISEEWGDGRRHAELPKNAIECTFDDNWRNNGTDKAFYSSAFTQGLILHKPQDKKTTLVKANKVIVFKLSAPRVEQDQCIAITGNCKELGNWDSSKAVVLSDAKFPTWQVSIDASKMPQGIIEYKYLIYNKNQKAAISWENGENRTINTNLITDNEVYFKSDEVFRYNIADFKCAGLAIPIFSLRSKNSFGIGEFSDLKPMSDWVKQLGQKVIQTLPITDTTRFRTNADSYPYSSITVMALHPIYINIFELGLLKDKATVKKFENLRDSFNESPTVMYQEVCSAKWQYFRLIFQQEGQKVLDSKEYKAFEKENKTWLFPYAAFCYLRDKHNDCNFRNWGDNAVFSKARLTALFKNEESRKEIDLHLYLQYSAHIQLLSAAKYANENGVILKGDIPIGISPESVEAWQEPELFDLNSQAGAPPDPFSETGQNWGFPTYDWNEMAKDNYQWWKTRFQKMETYFQTYRIDHVLGFFRIWRMDKGDVQGLRGYFEPALPLTEQEINNFGSWFQYNRFTHPYIREYMLYEIFGDKAPEIISVFLDLVSPGIYHFKDQFKTQRQLEAFSIAEPEFFKGQDGEKMYDAIMNLYCEVLFVEDQKQLGKFHPRIAMQNTYSYKDLDDNTKNALNNLYNDYFYNKHNQFWREQALKKLPALLNSNNMLVCAEDLGMIPACVPQVMQELFMLSLEIDRMPKDPTQEFVNIDHVPYLSVYATSTHDMNPIRGWWTEDRAVTQSYYNNILGGWGEAPQEAETWICKQIIERHLYSKSMLVILPFQDWMSIDEKHRRENYNQERINIPSDPKHFWCYRMHLNIEELQGLHELNNNLKQMVVDSQRF